MRRIGKRNKDIDWKYILTELLLIVVGILLAINLNSWSANRRLDQQVEQSILRVKEEIKLNMEELEDVLEVNKPTQDFYLEISSLTDEEVKTLECSVDKMQSFRKKYPEEFNVNDSTKVKKGVFKYEIDIQFSLEYTEVRDMAWRTAQLSNNISEYNYDCLQSLLTAYDLQEIFVNVQERFLDMTIVRDRGVYVSTYLLCYDLGEKLLERYKEIMEEIGDCD